MMYIAAELERKAQYEAQRDTGWSWCLSQL